MFIIIIIIIIMRTDYYQKHSLDGCTFDGATVTETGGMCRFFAIGASLFELVTDRFSVRLAQSVACVRARVCVCGGTYVERVAVAAQHGYVYGGEAASVAVVEYRSAADKHQHDGPRP